MLHTAKKLSETKTELDGQQGEDCGFEHAHPVALTVSSDEDDGHQARKRRKVEDGEFAL